MFYDFAMFTLYVKIFYSSSLGLGLGHGLDPALRPESSGLGLGLEGSGLVNITGDQFHSSLTINHHPPGPSARVIH